MIAIPFRVLGPLEAGIGERAVPLGGPKPRMLLATLLLQPNSVVATDVLIDVLWPDRAPRSAAANVRTYVHTLRRRLDESGGQLGERLRSRSWGYVLTLKPPELDCSVFEQHVAAGRRALATGDTGAALSELDAASGLWRGHLLEDLPHSHAWASRLARLTELRLSAEEQRLRLRIEQGGHCDAIAELRGLLTEHPLREELWQQLIVALDASGRRAEALHVYAEAEQVLLDELDVEPGPALRELRTRLAGDSKKGQRTTGADRCPLPVRQLPMDLPDFTGRARLIGELTRLLRENNRRGVPTVAVLSGPPGAGKSALAVHVAHAVSGAFPDGQLHIDLAGTSAAARSPLDVLAEVLRALGVPDTAMPRGLGERSALLRSRLARRRLCVVLDDAACAAQVRPLLPGTGGCAVVVTSRVRMPDLECAYPVEVGVLPEEDAFRLLTGIVGAQRSAAEPAGIATLLDYCGHLPLAIRVAGARLVHRPSWTVSTLALRLHDERRRLDELRLGDLEVRASVGLSYDQLPAEAALAFRLLALLGPVRFPGWMPAALLGRAAADDVLDTLVDAHLVEPVGADATGAPRYRLHDLLRCYAADKSRLDSVDDRRAAVRRALEGYLALALETVEAMPIHFFGMSSAGRYTATWSPLPERPLPGHLREGDPAAWFEAEHRWVVSAIELAARWGLDELAWRLTAAFTPFFDLRGHQDDWQHTHATALAAARRTGDHLGQAVILRNLGQVHLYQDSYDAAHAAFSEAADLFRKAGDDRGVAIALAGQGSVQRILGEYDEAIGHCHEALELFESAGDRHGEAVARIAVGSVWLALGCFACAGRWFTDARKLSATIGDQHREAHALKRLAALEQHRGNLGQARELVDRAIAIFHELGDDHCVGYANQNLGELYLCSGDLAHARLLLVNSLSVHRRNGDRRSQAQVAELLGQLHDKLGGREQSRRYFDHALAIWRDLEPEPAETCATKRAFPGKRGGCACIDAAFPGKCDDQVSSRYCS